MRQWRKNPGEPFLALLTLIFSGAIIFFAGEEWERFQARGLTPDGQRIYVARSIALEDKTRTGLYPAQIEALGGSRTTARLITSPLLRFNISKGNVRRADLVGAADRTAIELMGAQLAHGGLWETSDAALLLVLTRRTAASWFGDASKTVGGSLEIQNRLFTVSGVIETELPGFPEVGIWTNQIDQVESLFNNELRYRPPAFTLIRRPATQQQASVQREMEAIAAQVASTEGGSFRRRSMAAQPLSDFLLDEELRVRGGLLQTLALAILSASISVWLIYSARSMRFSNSNQIRLFLGLNRSALYGELVLEQALLAIAATVPLAVWRNIEGISALPDWKWVALCLGIPFMNGTVNVAFLAFLMHSRQKATLRLEPFIACHAATTIVLWMMSGMFYQDLRAAGEQANQVAPNTFHTLLAMPATDDPVFSRKFAERLRGRLKERAPNAEVGYSTWLPFLDNSSTDFLHRESEPPIQGGDDPRLVEFLPTNSDFLLALRPRLIAGRLPADKDDRDSWILLDRPSAFRHFSSPQEAIGRNVRLLRGSFQVLGVIDPLPYRGRELNPLPQVFLNAQTEKILFPYLALTIKVPDAPLQAPEILRQEIERTDKRVAAFRIEKIRDAIDRAVAPNRQVVEWLGLLIFGVNLALALGVFSLAKATLEFRQADFGTMLALGAGVQHLARVAFSRLALFCMVGIAFGAWGGIVFCREFQDQIRPDPQILWSFGLQAVAAIVCSTLLALGFPMRQLLLQPLASLLKEQPRSGRLPWA